MSKILTIGMVLGAIGVGALSSPTLARVEAGDRAAQCREQAYSMWQRGRTGDGLDRQRELITNSCMANGRNR
jgi:GH24 family phage-related lysozyme (muramidase)